MGLTRRLGHWAWIGGSAWNCGCIFSLTSPPWVLYFMCSFPSSGRLGPARAEVGLGFAVIGWFRRFRPPPPPLVWFRFRRPPVFFLALSGFARSGPGVFVLVFSLSLFFCVPLFASWLSNFHFMFIFISLSLSFRLPRCCGAYVYRCKASLYCRGVWHSCPTTRNEAVDMSGMGKVAGFLYLQLYIYIFI